MNPADELALIRQHVRRIEADLTLARGQLTDLERRLTEAKTAVLEPEVSTPAPAREPTLPPPLPPPLPASPPPIGSIAPSLPVPPAPRPPREFAPADDRPEDTGSPWREWLTALQLWPPAGEGDAEARLGAWWATRIGALLAVIGVVLFGVYVSVNTPPWVKFVELLAISAGMAGAGLWWERRVPRFGAVVFSAGLALLYFCAFAGYALPAVKVIDGVVAASLWQLAAVGVLAAAAVTRRSPAVAAMAVGLGYVTAVFSRFGGLHEFALAMAGLLAVASVGFHRLMRWEAPSVLAMPGSYAVLALALRSEWWPAGAVDPWWAWGYLTFVSVLFFARDWRGAVVDQSASWGDRWFQGVNAGLALLVGTVLALTLYRAQLAWFYAGAGLVLTAFGAIRRRQAPEDAMAPVFFAKAAGALALCIVEVADGRTTALALLAQAWVLYLVSGYMRSRTLAFVSGLVSGLAWLFFLASVRGTVAALSAEAAGSVLFAAGFALFTATAVRRVPGIAARRWLDALGGFAAFVAAWFPIWFWKPASLIPVWSMTMAAVLVVVSIVRRSPGAAFASAALILTAHALLAFAGVIPGGENAVLTNMIAVVGGSGFLGFWLGGDGAGRTVGSWAGAARVSGDVLWGVCVFTVAAVFYRQLSSPLIALVCLYGVALSWAGFAAVFQGRRFAWLSVWTVLLAVGWWAVIGAAQGDRTWSAVALALAWTVPFAVRLWPRLRQAVAGEPQGGAIEPLLVAAAALVTFRVLPWLVEPVWRIPLFTVSALMLAVGSLRCGLRAGIATSWMIWLMVWLAAFDALGKPAFAAEGVVYAATIILVWLPAVFLAKMIRGDEVNAWWSSHGVAIQAVIAATTGALLAVAGWRNAQSVFALLAVTLVAWGFHRGARLRAAGLAVGVLAVVAWLRAMALVTMGRAEGAGVGMAATLSACLGVAALPWLMKEWAGEVGPARRVALAWLAGASALGLAFLLGLVQRGTLAPYATVGWGAAAILLFVAGLFVRLRPYRLLGLAGLLVCIPRVFLVDLQSAFHRIVAFVVLGAVLLWVGFSYHRFRHLIVDAKEEP